MALECSRYLCQLKDESRPAYSMAVHCYYAFGANYPSRRRDMGDSKLVVQVFQDAGALHSAIGGIDTHVSLKNRSV